MRFGQRHRRLDAGRVEVAFAGEIGKRGHGVGRRRLREPGPERRVFIEQAHASGSRSAARRCATRARRASRAGAAPRAGAATIRRACGACPASVVSAWRRRAASAAGCGVAGVRSRNAASSSPRELELPSVAQRSFDGGAGHDVIGIEKWQAQPAHDFIESQAPGRAGADVSNACAMSGNSASGRPPSIANTVERVRAARRDPLGRRQRLRQQAFVQTATLAQLRIDDEQPPCGIAFELGAAPCGDQFELVLVVLRGGDGDRSGARSVPETSKCSSAPSRRSVSRCAVGRLATPAASRLSGGGCSSSSQARRGLRFCSTGQALERRQRFDQQLRFRRAARARAAKPRCASRQACAPS